MNPRSLSKHELLAIDDNVDFVGTVIDWIWAKPWPSDDRTQEYRDFFMALTKEQRVIWSTWRVQGEVQNGGFGQYFPNVKGDCFIQEAREGFEELGAHDLSAMFESVLAYFDKHRDQITSARNGNEYAEVMGYAAIEKNLNGVTQRFLSRMTDFYRLRREYILRHLDAFCDAP